MFKWFRNGTVEAIPGPFSNGEVDQVFEIITNSTNLPTFGRKKRQTFTRPPPIAMEMEIKVGFDKSFKDHLEGEDKAKQYWRRTLPHVQNYYCNFQTKIILTEVSEAEQLIDREIKADGCCCDNIELKIQCPPVEKPEDKCQPKDCADLIKDIVLKPTQEQFDNHKSLDLVVYLSHDAADSFGTVGVANTGSVCTASGRARSINECNKDEEAKCAGTVAHEIGHNLGMLHDFDEEHGGDGKKSGGCVDNHPYVSEGLNGIMSYEESNDIWTQCNINDFLRHYSDVTGKGHILDNWCAPPLAFDDDKVNKACGGDRDGMGTLTEDSSVYDQLEWLNNCENFQSETESILSSINPLLVTRHRERCDRIRTRKALLAASSGLFDL